MVRMLIRVALHIAGNAIGLILANLLLSDMSLDASAFIIALLIFTGVEILVQPLLRQIAFKNQASAIQGSTALITTFVALLVTDLISDGLSISGGLTWVLATIIVWLATMLAGIILPMIFLKNAVEERRK
jgi:putative membrane protein